MIILGIESSCDDTSAAIVKDGKEILSLVTSSQDQFHKEFNGVVPEIAARKHLDVILPVIQNAIKKAKINHTKIDCIAVTTHPGLIGSLLIGTIAAKTLAYVWGKPLLKVNHLRAHMYSVEMSNTVTFPYIGLIVSGGHTLLTKSIDKNNIKILGSTTDDACGEAFDKIAKFYDLGYPGGPIIDKMSQTGNEDAINYPMPLLKKEINKFNFSYSGIKTAVIYQTEQFKKVNKYTLNDIAASFQKKAIDVLFLKTEKAATELKIDTICVSGGVSANSYLRKKFSSDNRFKTFFPPMKLCADNAAMVAGAAFLQQETNNNLYQSLSLNPQARMTIMDKL